MTRTTHYYPESPVLYRSLTRRFPKITHGQGCWLVDENGKKYLDACGGAYVANLGHGLSEIADAVAGQIRKVAYVNGTAFTNEPTEELAAELAALCPPGLDKCFFLSSGSEAVEAALKLARQYWVETGKPGKHKIIALNPGYHGNTLLAMSASARMHYKKIFAPWLVPVTMIPAPYAYRCALNSPALTGAALEEAFIKEGPDTIAAFIAEPVGGSSTGACLPPPDYFLTIRALCDRYGVLFIADEVLSGSGRTGKWAAIEHFSVAPDIMTFGKGLSGGALPLSAVVASRALLDPIARGSGAFKHAQTFSHFPAACAAGVAAIRYIKSHNLIARVAEQGRVLQERLAPLRDLPGVGDVRGIGLLAAIEFVSDKKNKTPYPRAQKIAEAVFDAAQEEGLMVWPNVGQADGDNGDLVTVAPPFIISDSEITEIATRLKSAILRVIPGDK